MTVREMHYDFKQKLNEIDSQRYRGLKVPEIDWKLNEAQEVLVKIVAQPRLGRDIGFEVNQRIIDDVRTIVVHQKEPDGQTVSEYDKESNIFISALPNDYWFYVNSSLTAIKGTCSKRIRVVRIVQHDDLHEQSLFDKSSFDWGEVNVAFNKDGMMIYADSTFKITKAYFEYMKEPKMIHNAADWIGGTYNTLEGVALTGRQNCELPRGIHREIVDLAVLITAGDLNLPSYMLKQNKVKLTQ